MKYSFSFLFIFLSIFSFAQLDSVMDLVNKETDASKQIEIIDNYIVKTESTDQTLNLARKAFAIASIAKNESLQARAGLLLGKAFGHHQLHDSSNYYVEFSEKKYNKLNDHDGLFKTYLLKAELLKRQGKLINSLDYTNKCVDMAEHLDDPEKKAAAYFKMALLFISQNDIEKQILYFNKALKLYQQVKNINEIENCYYRLGNCYIAKNYYDFAIEYFERGLELNEVTKNCMYKVSFLSSIGHVYFNLSNNAKALHYFKEALAMQEKCAPDNVMFLKNNIGVALMDMERYAEAKPYLIEFFFYTKNPRDKADGAFNLAQVYEQLGDYKSSIDFMDMYVRINDSLNNAIHSKNLSEIEAKYRNEKQEEQNILLKERVRNKSRQIYLALAGIALLIGMLFFIFRGLRQKHKANLALEEKNKIIEEKNAIVEEQHKDITDSIKYAERIQKAILPPDKLWNKILPQSFVFYQPKDILSGDFYWIEETATHIYVAAADCTGHGVPGALISIVNYNLLNKAVLEQGLTDAGKILDCVNIWLTDALHQTFQESTVRDGMDVSLCVIEKATRKMNYAGAFNSIYIVNGQEINELRADKQPVGAFIEDNIKNFTNKFHQLRENDVVYMFTDGYADQFGGENGKKFKYKNMQHLLLEVHPLPFPEQKKLVSKAINNWKGKLEQIDDILLLGFKLS